MHSGRDMEKVIYKVETPAHRQKKLSCGFHNISQIESHEFISWCYGTGRKVAYENNK